VVQMIGGSAAPSFILLIAATAIAWLVPSAGSARVLSRQSGVVYAATRRHCCAHSLQASAQRLQWSWLCSPHCSAHQLQASAHTAATWLAKRLCAAISFAVRAHNSAHSKQHWGQSFELSMPVICDKQSVQATVQAWQASMAAVYDAVTFISPLL